jgi:hypothetical protein
MAPLGNEFERGQINKPSNKIYATIKEGLDASTLLKMNQLIGDA